MPLTIEQCHKLVPTFCELSWLDQQIILNALGTICDVLLPNVDPDVCFDGRETPVIESISRYIKAVRDGL